MATDPSEQMRYHILEMRTYNLAEQSGIFCDSMSDNAIAGRIDFGGAQFIFNTDEPYEVYFEWYFGDVKAGLSFHADRDDSEWSVVCDDGRRHRRIRGRIVLDGDSIADPFLLALENALNG